MPGILILVLLLASRTCDAWSDGGYSADQNDPDYGTHDWIAEKALDLQTRNVTFLESTYHARFLLGTEAPDNPEFIGDTANHHVYFNSEHQLEDDVAAERAASLYQGAVSYLKTGNYELAAFDVGVMAHYIADVAVFGHTMGAPTDWGDEIHHSDYENEVDNRLGTFSAPTSISMADSDAYNATLNLAELTTFGSGAIRANKWMDDNYDWSNAAFVSSAAESIKKAVEAVASAVNHLLARAGISTPDPTETPDPTPDSTSDPKRTDPLLVALIVSAFSALVATVSAVLLRRARRRSRT